LTKEQREIVHVIADKMALNHISRGEEPDRVLFVYKPGVIIGTPTKRKATREALKQTSNTPLPKASHVEEVIAETKVTKKKGGPVKKNKQQEQQGIPQSATDDQPRYLLRSRRK
jgi:hypothetical protein